MLVPKGWFKPFAIRPCKTRDRWLARSARARLCNPKTVETEPRQKIAQDDVLSIPDVRNATRKGKRVGVINLTKHET